MKNEIKELHNTILLWTALVCYGIGGTPLILYILESWSRDYSINSQYLLQRVLISVLAVFLACISLRNIAKQRKVEKPFHKLRTLLLKYIGVQVLVATVVGAIAQGLSSLLGLGNETIVRIIPYLSRGVQTIIQVMFLYALANILLENKVQVKNKKQVKTKVQTKKQVINVNVKKQMLLLILLSLLMEIGIIGIEHLLEQKVISVVITIIEATKIIGIWTYLCMKAEGMKVEGMKDGAKHETKHDKK